MFPSAPAQPIETARPPAWGRLRWPQREEAFPLAFYAVVMAVLAASGYPARRVAVVGALAVTALLGRILACRQHDPKQCVNRDMDQLAWFMVATQGCVLLGTAATVALTGGIRSPLLVTLAAGWFSAVAVVGDRRQTRLLLGVTCLAMGALALLPPRWTGPELSASTYAVLSAASVLGVGALLAPILAIVRRKRDEFIRARDEMAADALTRARSLEQVGAKVAHELKNPLAAVKALVQLGLRNPAEASSQDRLQVIEKEVTRMQEILQNYLSFTRPLQAVTPKRVALGPLVSDTLVVLSARADHARVRLFTQGDATVEADPRRLKEALLNLVANAIEATPPGGEVFVEVRGAGDETEIVIRDNGRGMPAETLRRIGTPFFTTRDDGTGLGVVLARSVITQHGGSLRYDSEPGKGTMVKVALPSAVTGARDGAGAARR